MVILLRVLFAGMLAGMLVVTISASFEQSIVEASRVLWPDPWFRATLTDAYFGFLTVYVWIAYKERSLVARVVWFLAVMGLGNIAIASYVLLQLRCVKPGEPLERVLLRSPSQV